MGETSEPEIDLVNCVSWGDQTEICQRQANMIRGVPANPKSYYDSMRFISSSKRSHFTNGVKGHTLSMKVAHLQKVMTNI